MAATRSVLVPSYAKVNLDLRVLHRRADGFHEIRSLFHTISLADRMRIAWTPGKRLTVSTTCAGLNIPMESNLAHRAALAYCERSGARGELKISISKRIPHGGGLGGGSSNAAAVMLALGVLTRRPMPLVELLECAAAIGSDVPFFLAGGAAVVAGRGEEIYPAPDFPPMYGLLAAPGIAVSTPEAYRALGRKGLDDRAQSTASATLRWAFHAQLAAAEGLVSRWDGKAFGQNDFEGSVFALHPSLLGWKRRLRRAGAIHAMMSGSGSSVFGLFGSREKFRQAVEALRGAGPIHPFRVLTRRQYRKAWIRALSPGCDSELWPPHPTN